MTVNETDNILSIHRDNGLVRTENMKLQCNLLSKLRKDSVLCSHKGGAREEI